MRFVLRRSSDHVATAEAALLSALGLPGGGIVEVGSTHVRVVPAEVAVPNEMHLPDYAFNNGAGEPGSATDVTRAVVPPAGSVVLRVDGHDATTIPRELLGVPVHRGDRIPTPNGIVEVVEVSPSPVAIVTSSSTVRPDHAPPAPPVADAKDPEFERSMIAGLDNEYDLLAGWLGLLTNGSSPTTVAGLVLSGPPGSGKFELTTAAASDVGLKVSVIDLRTVTTAESMLAKLEGAVRRTTPGSVLYLKRVDPLLHRESGFRLQAAAVLRWFLDTVATTPGVVAVVASRSSTLASDVDARDLLPRTLTIAAPNHERRKQLLAAAIGKTDAFDLDTLANASPGFSALDISTAVLDAKAVQGTALTIDGVLDAIRSTQPSLGAADVGDVPTYGFERVANLERVKQSLTETVIWQLTQPERFQNIGIEPPRGLLLHGPPGTGKTFVIRALAKESGAAFFPVKGAELLDKWVGESERGVREVFARARAVAPSIIFFDEVDALAPPRGTSSNNVTDSVVAALLTELDGIASRGDVFVIGATNRRDLIDPALLRPGRLEVHLHLDLPAPESRAAFFEMTSITLEDDVDVADLIAMTEGASFADLDGLLRKAALNAMRGDPHASTVSARDLESALVDAPFASTL